MSNITWTPWRLIKAGFFIGVGIVAPLLIAIAIAFGAIATISTLMFNAYTDVGDDIYNFPGSITATDIKIESQREVINGTQLLILGNIKNTGDAKASSIQLEAELFDANGEFVYECSEYISQTLQPGDSEHYQIKCGCKEKEIPSYETATVKVTSASSY